MWFSEPLPQKSHLGLALRYVPEGLERWNCTRRKASRFSTGLYSLVKVQQVEVAFLEEKVVKMCGFRNPCPKMSQPLMGVWATFWTTFSRNVTKESEEWATFWTDVCKFWGLSAKFPRHPSWGSLPLAKGARLAAGRTSARLRVDFPLKNKVEGLSPSTPRMVRQVWPHLRTTLGLALPSLRRASRYPPKFWHLHRN